MINPVTHSQTPAGAERYKAEPYVMAGDIYSVSPHSGRGGWTWYTGSAGWMYRLIMETFLGLKLEPDKLRIQPRVPSGWGSFKVRYRYRQTSYEIAILSGPSHGLSKQKIILDGIEQADAAIPLVDDHREHRVEIQFG
jgi:cellobiose phosphorylase